MARGVDAHDWRPAGYDAEARAAALRAGLGLEADRHERTMRGRASMRVDDDDDGVRLP